MGRRCAPGPGPSAARPIRPRPPPIRRCAEAVGVESLLPAISHWLAQWGSMGGYAAFVWPAYAVAVAVLGGLSWHAWRAHRVSEKTLDRLTRRGDSDGGQGR